MTLDTKRIVEREVKGVCKNPFCRNTASLNMETGEKVSLNCRSWRCPVHRYNWGRKWGFVIAEQAEETPITLLLNLTTAEMITNEDLEKALRRFIRFFRKDYGPTEYVKSVEYNKNHTQPHFHLLLVCDELVIPDKPEKWPKDRSWPEPLFYALKKLWQECLDYARPDLKPTTVIWCQPPEDRGKKSAWYAVGYITGNSQKSRGKDEEPDETWKGRKLTYSKKFFRITPLTRWNRFLDRLFPDRKQLRFTMLVPDIHPCEQAESPSYRLSLYNGIKKLCDAINLKNFYARLPKTRPDALLVSHTILFPSGPPLAIFEQGLYAN